jgi:replicative DNA helicase
MITPEVAQYEVLAKEILRRCMAEEEPEDLFKFVSEMLARMGAGDDSAALTWEESFEFSERMLDEYERLAKLPESERKLLTFPWQSWNNLISPLEPGMLALVTAPDGQGKTIFAESVAEHWARHKNRVVFVHYELNRKLMMLRRIARHTMIQVRDMTDGRTTAEQRADIKRMRARLESWDGYITYLHTPGWTMEKLISELRRLHAEGKCDVVVFDYLEKASASKRQLQMFGSNVNNREADNVEQLKTFAEMTESPVFMVAQMNKEAKGTSFDRVDRTGIRGAGEKSDKSNLVIILKRERNAEGYSNEVEVLVDKNTMGRTGTFKQFMQPEYFRVADYIEPTA